MLRKGWIVLLTCLMALAFSQAAFAGLTTMGPINTVAAPGNGFPQWYTDANGVTVELPIPPLGDGVTAPTMIYGPLTATSNAVAKQAGFDTEAFFFVAKNPKAFQTKFGKALVLLGLEASYANGTPTDGQQTVFSRIRLTASVQVAGTYTFFHPWGTETINVTANDLLKQPALKFTKDVGLGAAWNADLITPIPTPGGFYGVLQAANTMSTFLRAVSPAPALGWIGNGVSETTFTGSPIAYNKIRLEGPAGIDLDGRGNNFVESTTMVISGHVPASTAVPLPLSLDRVTCSHPLAGVEHIDLFVTTRRGSTLTVKDAVSGAILWTDVVTSTTGKYFSSFVGTAKSITVTGSAAGFTPTTVTSNVVDYINITRPNYSLINNTLTVTATSSDFAKAAIPPTLTVVGFGPMTVNTTTGLYSLVVPITVPLPPTVTVISTTGGSDSASVAIVP